MDSQILPSKSRTISSNIHTAAMWEYGISFLFGVDLGVMAIKWNSLLHRSSELEPPHQIQFDVILNIPFFRGWGVKPFTEDIASVYLALPIVGIFFLDELKLNLLIKSESCNGYHRRKWTRRHEFKSWTWLIIFHVALIPLGKVWIRLFSLQLWVNSRADLVLFALVRQLVLGGGKLCIQTC